MCHDLLLHQFQGKIIPIVGDEHDTLCVVCQFVLVMVHDLLTLAFGWQPILAGIQYPIQPRLLGPMTLYHMPPSL